MDNRLRGEYAETLKKNYLTSGFKQGFEAGYAKAKEDFERPHGEWEQVGEMKYKCTRCGWIKNIGLMPYCENCGADMREGEKNDV